MKKDFQRIDRKPIQEMTEDEKDQAIYSARYILEDYFEEGKSGVEALSERIGVIPGVVHSALENIFGVKISNLKKEGGDSKEIQTATILAAAKDWIEGDMGWEYIYDQIFSKDIAVKFRNLYPSFDYCDPDTSCKDDVLAWYRAAKDYIENLAPKTKGDWIFAHSSGYDGYRCTKCATWVYAGDKKECECDK